MSRSIEQFNCLINEFDTVYHEAALYFGLSDSAMMILYTLCSYDGSCLIENITHMTGLSKQTLNSALRNLERGGIVVTESAGGRKKRVSLTDKGNDFAEGTVGKLLGAENRIINGWSEEEWSMYLRLTERFLTSLKNEFGAIKAESTPKKEEI